MKIKNKQKTKNSINQNRNEPDIKGRFAIHQSIKTTGKEVVNCVKRKGDRKIRKSHGGLNGSVPVKFLAAKKKADQRRTGENKKQSKRNG